MNNYKFGIKVGTWAIFILAIALGIVLRWVGLLRDSLWYDEIVTLNLAKHPLGQLFSGILSLDSHPPLFLVLSKSWFYLFGLSDFSARALSATIGSFSILAVFLLGKAYGNLRTAVFAGVIVSFHHFAVYYSQEFRSYELLFALTALSLCQCEKWFSRKSADRMDFFLLVITNTLLLYTHYYSLLVIFFEILLYLLTSTREPSENFDQRWWLGQAIPVSLLCFWLPGLTYHAFHLRWLHLAKAVNLNQLFYVLSPFAGSHRLSSQPFLVQAMPFILLALFIYALPNFAALNLFRIPANHILTSSRFIIDRKNLFLKLCSFYLLGLFLLTVSFFPFRSAGASIASFDWRSQAFEGFIVHSSFFALIIFGACIAEVVRAGKTLRIELKNNEIARYVFGLFPLLMILIVEAMCFTFKPNYEPRNMIIILPSYICAISWTLGKIKNEAVWVIVLAAAFFGFLTQIDDAKIFRNRCDYRGIARIVEEKSVELRRNLSVATISLEANTSIHHYLKRNEIIDCRSDCDNKLAGKEYVFWIWHDFYLPSENPSKLVLRKNLEENRVLFSIKSKGVVAALLKYAENSK